MATRTIGTDIKLTGEKEFNAGMKAMNSNLKTLRTDMAVLSAEFDGNAESMEALTAKEKLLGESIAQHEAKVDALRQMYALWLLAIIPLSMLAGAFCMALAASSGRYNSIREKGECL